MNVYIASDHAGFELKKLLLPLLDGKDFNLIDLGPNDIASVDYPDYANLVCEKLRDHPEDFGILVCGSGQGMCLRANKYPYVRAALVYSEEISRLSREHNNANVICVGSRFCTLENAEIWINIFLNTPFSEGRHRQRVDKISSST